jgi:hypothetical protein
MPIPLVIFLILFLFLFAYSSHFFLLSQNLVSLPSFFSFPQKKNNRVTITLQILSAKWRLSLSLPGGGGPWVKSFLPPHQHFSINCRHFPSRTRGGIFHQISKDFYSSAQLEYFFTVCDVKKHAVSCKKNLYNTDCNFHQQRCTFQSG